MSQNDKDAEFGGGGADERQQQYPSWQRQQHQQYPQAPSYQQQDSQPPSYQYPSLQEQQHQQHQQALSQQQQHHQLWFAQQQQQQPQQHQVPMRNPQTPQYPPAEASFPPSTGHASAFTATPGDGGLHRHATPAMGPGFGIVGQTPVTAASFGSSIGAPTPQHAGVGGMVGAGVGPWRASFGYGGGPGALRETTGEAMMDPGAVGAPGLLHGNDPLQPTPVVRRMVGGEGGRGGISQQQPMQQEQQQMGMQGAHSPYNTSAMLSSFPSQQRAQQQQQHFGQQREQQSQQRMQPKKRLPSVKEEEDPSMLRYESRPGLDTSPMAGDKDPQSAEGGGQGRDQKKDEGTTDETGKTHPNRTPMPPAGHSRHVSSGQRMPQDLSTMATTSSFSGPLQRVPPGDQSQHADQTIGDPGMLQEFPFFFDGYAAWVCRHCHHVPPYYRGGNYVWQSTQPPPNHFVDMHLKFCPGLNPGNLPPPAAMQHQQQYQQQPPFLPPSQESGASFPYPMLQQQPQNSFMQQAQQPMFQQQSLYKQSYGSQEEIKSPEKDQGAPDPPGLRSPLPPTRQITDREQGGKTGEIVESSAAAGQSQGAPHQGVHWDFPLGGRSSSFQPPYPYHPYPPHMMQMPPVVGEAAGQYLPSMTMLHPTSPMELSPPRGSKKRKASPASKASPMGRHTDDATYKISKDFLAKTTLESARPSSEGSDLGQTLVDPSDAELLTDYFYHMLQQLVICRFSEKDRKTRGGKRENINIGYGGLQCIHCENSPSARKFFWSTVDRLANSFAEIPSHVLKCKLCPVDVKSALLALKGRHHDQMQLLPRGSQKVFFRRMWRRLHDPDSSSATPVKSHRSLSEDERGLDPPSSTVASPESALPAAASLLAMGANLQLDQSQELRSSDIIIPEEKRERVLLAIPEDKDWLSDMDCFLRKNIEVFTAKQSDVEYAAADRKYPIKVGQVGIRCVYCTMTSGGARNAAVSYPYSISGMYESVREFQRMHLETCPNIPQDINEASEKLEGGTSSLSSVLRRYYVQAARALGLFDTQDDGIAAGGKPVPMSTAGFQSPAPTSRTSAKDAPGTAPDDDRKIELTQDPDDEEEGPEESGLKRIKLEDAPGIKSDTSKQRDAPAKDDVPGMEDAPGEKVTMRTEREDAPGDKAVDSLIRVAI